MRPIQEKVLSVSYKVVIPARYASSRLPGKPLLKIGDRSLLEHVHQAACRSGADQVIVATDDDRIAEHIASSGATVVMTDVEHQSGTDRINEALEKLGIAGDQIIVNVQGDEYGLQPELIGGVAAALASRPDSAMATLCEPITDISVYTDPNSVKVVTDINNSALYFSRSPVPWGKQGSELAGVYKHIGIYAYRADFLRTFASLPHAPIELRESLEQLRALYHGYRIHVERIAHKAGIEINTEEDLDRARKALGRTEQVNARGR